MTVKDFELALVKLLTDDTKKTFAKLDSEYAYEVNGFEGEGRVEPAHQPVDLQWSLSQWRDLRNQEIQGPSTHNDGAIFDPAQNQPEEISTLATLFPNFYASVPDAHLNG